jgi:hypothetical protein
MADMFRRELDRRVSLGGVHSKDCNPYHGKSKSLLRRLARRTTNRIEDYEKEDYNEKVCIHSNRQNNW